MKINIGHASEDSHSGRSRILKAAAVFAASLALVGGMLAWRAHRRQVHDRDIAAMAAEPAKLDKAVASGEVTPQLRDAALREQGRQATRSVIDGYFAVPPGKAREDYLDRVLDRYQQVRRERQAPDAIAVPQQPPAQAQLETLENIPAAEKARIAEFIAALGNRMHQRGISITAGG